MRFAVVTLFLFVSLTCATDDAEKNCGKGAKWYGGPNVCKPCDQNCTGPPIFCPAICRSGCGCLPNYKRVNKMLCVPEKCCPTA